jgi:hypothetical protein
MLNLAKYAAVAALAGGLGIAAAEPASAWGYGYNCGDGCGYGYGAFGPNAYGFYPTATMATGPSTGTTTTASMAPGGSISVAHLS